MGRILFAWELGSNFGHVSRLLPVALALRARGHDVDFVLREPPRGRTVLQPHGFRMLQAPVWLGRAPAGDPAPTFAGVLRRCGYDRPASLAGLTAGWARLFQLAVPDLVVLDHAPTAALAAQIAGIPCVRIGSGWFAPPDVSPLPVTEPWRRVDGAVAEAGEAQVLAVVNRVLGAAQRPPLQRVTQIYRLEADFLTTFAELDHYGARAGLRYWGPTERPVAATPPHWPAGEGPRIFGFVEAGYAGLDPLLRTLAALGLPVLLYVRDLPPPKARSLSTATLSVVAEPVDLAAAARQAALVICHAGHGTICEALLAGTPLLLLPRQAEQRWLCDRVKATGAALTLLATKDRTPRYEAAIRRLLEKPAFAGAACDFAARHAGHDATATGAAIAADCEAVLRSRPAPRATAALSP